MARKVRDAALETRTARAKLKPAAQPYYRALSQGLHIGYRKGKAAGQWVMRSRGADLKYAVAKLGVADDTIDPDGAMVLSFAQAQEIARTRFLKAQRVAAGLPANAGPYTVKCCMEDYLAWLAREGKTGADARTRSDALIAPVLGAIRCDKLTTKAINDWMDKLATSAARKRTAKAKPQQFRTVEDEDPDEGVRRRRSTANRMLTTLKAALNKGWRDKKIASDDAWRSVKPFPEADSARIRYLTVAEAKRLINAAAPDFRRLVQAALYTGCRVSELAALEVSDFNPDTGTVHIRTSKSGKGRHVVLTEEGSDLFRSVCIGRSGRERLFVRQDGSRWGNNHQSRPMADACKAASIEPPIGFHGLRHSYASLTIMNGAPLLVVAKNLGHSDTRMVERHYGHMSPSYVADAIRAAAPGFGFKADCGVVTL